jgi:hypothetical protein
VKGVRGKRLFGLTCYGQELTSTSLSPFPLRRAALRLPAIHEVPEPPLQLARLIDPCRSQHNRTPLNGRHRRLPGRCRLIAPCPYSTAATHRWQSHYHFWYLILRATAAAQGVEMYLDPAEVAVTGPQRAELAVLK